MERSIKTKSGKIFEVSACSSPEMYSKRNLFIDIINGDMAEIASVFSDKEETEVITEYYNDEQVNQYVGYIVLTDIKYDIGTKAISVGLMLPEREEDGVWVIQ